MTNGEKIKEIFPYLESDETDLVKVLNIDNLKSWWNAEYKEPTTRNCFGCKYSKDNHNAGTEECHLCMWENQYTPTIKNDLGVDCIDRAKAQTAIEMNAFRYTLAKERGGTGRVEWDSHLIAIDDAVDIIRNLPSVTPQLSSGLDKNSKKLEKDFGESDCIDRQATLDAIIKRLGIKNETYLLEAERVIYQQILAMPSVTPQPRKGHWNDIPKYKDIAWYCSECERFTTVKHNYCPLCGADMREIEE